MGPSAVSATAKLMLTARPITVTTPLGVVELVPGSVWQENRVLIDCSETVVHYMLGSELYECTTQSFVRDALLNALALGASRAQWLVHVAKVEREFLMGLFVPIVGIVGLTCAQVLVVHTNHRKACSVVLEQAPKIIADLKIIRREVPTLYHKIFGKVAGEIVSHVPDGVSAEDIAFWLGRILKGVGALPDFKVTALTKILLIVTTLVSLTHSPGIAGRSAIAAIKQLDVERELRKLQLEVSGPDAAQIAVELNAAKESRTALRRLQESLKIATPSVREIFEAWEKARG